MNCRLVHLDQRHQGQRTATYIIRLNDGSRYRGGSGGDPTVPTGAGEVPNTDIMLDSQPIAIIVTSHLIVGRYKIL